MGAYAGGTFAYLTRRGTAQAGADGGRMQELDVCTCGPSGAALAAQVTARLQAWNHAMPSIGSLRVDAYPAGMTAAPGAFLAIRKHHTELHAYTSAA